MDDLEAIEHYNAAGCAVEGRFAPVRWPDLVLTLENLGRLFEGVVASRVDVAGFVFGDGGDEDDESEGIEEAWRLDALQTRFAPEGIFMRAVFTVRVARKNTDEKASAEQVDAMLEGELCLSFVERLHTRPFVDFMGGKLRLGGDEPLEKVIDAFSLMVEPQDAVVWGMNGVDQARFLDGTKT